jgi:hypothetical protein
MGDSEDDEMLRAVRGADASGRRIWRGGESSLSLQKGSSHLDAVRSRSCSQAIALSLGEEAGAAGGAAGAASDRDSNGKRTRETSPAPGAVQNSGEEAQSPQQRRQRTEGAQVRGAA